MNEHSAYEFNPEMPLSSRRLFDQFRLLTVAGLLFAMFVASLIAR
jgi:hypothetical protein